MFSSGVQVTFHVFRFKIFIFKISLQVLDIRLLLVLWLGPLESRSDCPVISLNVGDFGMIVFFFLVWQLFYSKFDVNWSLENKHS